MFVHILLWTAALSALVVGPFCLVNAHSAHDHGRPSPLWMYLLAWAIIIAGAVCVRVA